MSIPDLAPPRRAVKQSLLPGVTAHSVGPFQAALRWLAGQLPPSAWIGLESRHLEWGIQAARILLVGGWMGFTATYDDWEQVRLVTLAMGAVMLTYTALFIVLLGTGRTRMVVIFGLILDPLTVGAAVLVSAALLDQSAESPVAMVGPGTALPLLPAVIATLLRLRPLPGVVVAVLVAGGVGAGTVALSYENPTVSQVVPRTLGMTTIAVAIVGVAWSIQQLYRQLQQSVADNLQLVSTVTHELRGPLAALRAGLDLLLDSEVDRTPDQEKEMVRNAARSTTRMEQLIDVLAQVERAESPDMAAEPEALNLHTVTMEVRKAMSPLADEREITIGLADFYGLPLAWADRRSVEHILSNLLSNALKFSADGGLVTIRGYTRPGAVGIGVEDHGMGIPEADQRRIFERFYRGTDPRKRGMPGTGLGLYVSRSLVERSGGQMWFTSAPDVGSAFTFSLPLCGSKGAPEAARRNRAGGH